MLSVLAARPRPGLASLDVRSVSRRRLSSPSRGPARQDCSFVVVGASEPCARAMADDAEMISLQAAIFDPATLKGRDVTIEGGVVLLDLERERMDLSAGGAKLICRVHGVDAAAKAALREGAVVRATGRVAKEQRRTLLEASRVVVVRGDPG